LSEKKATNLVWMKYNHWNNSFDGA